MNLSQELIEKIGSTFRPSNEKRRRARPCRIKFNGEFVVTRSNKTVWQNIGHAKAAALCHLEYAIPGDGLRKETGYNGYDVQKRVLRELERIGAIQYVEASESELVELKNS